MDHQCIFISIIIFSPDSVGQCVKGDDVSAVFIQLFQKSQFLGGQSPFFCAVSDDAAFQEDSAVSKDQRLVLRLQTEWRVILSCL